MVAVTDVLEVNGMPGLLMEYIDGPSLKEWLHRMRPALPEALRVFRGIVKGVGRAHDLEIIHRDLKPGNVMLQDVDGVLEPKVADFGLAKALDNLSGSQGMQQTRTGVAMGTPAYMAPEQIRDAKNVDRRADLFSLGAILYELVTGQLAFPGDDLFEVFSKVVAGRYVPPETLVAELPAPVLRAIHGCLRSNRDERLDSCAEILSVLDGEVIERHVSVQPMAPAQSQRPAAPAWAEAGGVQQVPASSGTWNPEADPAPLMSQPTLEPAGLGSLPAAPAKSQETFDPGSLGAEDLPAEPPAPPPVAAPTGSKVPLVLGALVLAGLGAGAATLLGGDDPGPAPPAAEADLTPAPAEPLVPEPVPEPEPVAEPAPVPTPEPVTKPAARAQAAPKPPAPAESEPEPTSEPAGPAPAIVRQSGADVLALVSASGRFPPGEVPPGRYTVEATFGDATVTALQIHLSAGEQVTITCDASFKMCRR